MTRLPRDLSGRDLAVLLRRLGYEITRQTGSHIRLTTAAKGEHHLTVADHKCLRVGTVAGILAEVAAHLGMNADALRERLFE